MDIMSLVKGAAAGAAAGIAFSALSSAGPLKKNSIKRNAGKTIKAAEDLLSDLSSVFR